jgi:hypothetical protein
MKIAKILLLLIAIPLFTSAVDHKFYASITKIEYVKERQTLQIISKIFVDDLEDVLQQRYDNTLSLNTPKETDKEETFLKEYLNKKIEIAINGKPVTFSYVGREYDIDIINVYLEISGVSEVNTLGITNEILMEMFEDQQNIIHFKSGDIRRSIVLEKDSPKGMLNFN